MLDHEIIKSLIKQGIQIKFMPASEIDFSGAEKFVTEKEIDTVGEIEGFYKSNAIWLYKEDGFINAFSRYGEYEGQINSIDDLVIINYNWWKLYRNTQPWNNIETFWLEHMLRLDLVEKKITVSYIPKD